jgi:hypothetical protein
MIDGVKETIDGVTKMETTPDDLYVLCLGGWAAGPRNIHSPWK